jgi:hypothetical protein
MRLTYKIGGKSVTEALPSKAALERARREIAEFRKFQELSRELIRVNSEICKLKREGEVRAEEELKKKRNGRYSR